MTIRPVTDILKQPPLGVFPYAKPEKSAQPALAKLDESRSVFKKTLREEAIELIEKKLPDKIRICRADKNGIMLIDPKNIDNEEFHAEIEKYTGILKRELIKFAGTSDINALFLKKFLNNPSSTFSFSGEDCGTLYYNQFLKTILIPLDIIDKLKEEEIPSSLFQEGILHELAHAADDFQKADEEINNTMQPAFLSADKLNKELEPFLKEDLCKTAEFMEKLKILRKEKLKKQNPQLDENALNETAEKELYKINKKDTDEIELLNEYNWCYFTPVEDEYIIIQFVIYLSNRETYDERTIMLEYAAHGVQFVFSQDKDKQRRLQKINPDFFKYINETLIGKLCG